ncbi:4-hydroxy-3-methylbut-2-enyl diphosphate reductase [Marinilabilia salmonicolor]|uniref:4-hydroxy-3-methylbut-2-enyl diphosphate reductase n=1 Tax=Marinilabilia salmonicolor TaxID=989 RepID=UPI00029A3EC3|nr:4-hydroxy-3-methylbut-2-enyl diphosphate reductase [Marinilabilia salmonicolor]
MDSSVNNKQSLYVEIDDKSGFCFGVVRAISKAEEEIGNNGTIYSLGDIVHNDLEVERLNNKGMQTIDHRDLENMKEGTVFFRAHGEPPESYQKIKEKGLKLIDATCPVVLKLQQRVRVAYEEMKDKKGQIAIYGKIGHAEVKGLSGQTNHEAIILEKEEDVRLIDPGRPVVLFSQTTKSPEVFKNIAAALRRRAINNVEVQINDTICRQVSNRAPHLQRFARKHDVVIFVGGAKSSNAQSLYKSCLDVNPQTHFISSPEDLQSLWFASRPQSTGVCGATSTPAWLMKIVAEKIRTF